MSQRVLATVLLLFVLVPGVFADLVFPASFEMVEETPDQFRIGLTLPMVQGRFAKARPLLPNVVHVEGEPATRAGTASITRTWQARVQPASLAGSAIGLEGLLGTALEVPFLLSTLDGRRHETVLRPTQPFLVVPYPPRVGELASEAVREGLRQTTRRLGLWFLLAGLLVAGANWRRGIRIAAALSVILLTALLAGFTGILTLPTTGLSGAETRMAAGFLGIGWCMAGLGMAATLGLAESILSERARRGVHTLLFIAASAWLFYQAAGLIVLHGPSWLVALQRIFDRFVYRWFTPFATDWAMARLRIPWVSLLVIFLGGWALVHTTRGRTRVSGGGALLALAVLLLPWGTTRASIPFLSPKTPTPAQARRILEPMMSRIYHALNLEDEDQTYDRLSEQVSGELITDLYLDSRRRLIAGTREGASLSVLGVEVLEVGAPRAGPSEARGFMFPCRWTVTAKVTHWQHSHERRNLYQGDLRLAVEENLWKLAGIELHSEEREVVPGSFSSR